MNPVPRVAGRIVVSLLAPWPLAAALSFAGPDPAAGQGFAPEPSAPPSETLEIQAIRWKSREALQPSMLARCPAWQKEGSRSIPDYFWDYMGTRRKAAAKAWNSNPYEKQYGEVAGNCEAAAQLFDRCREARSKLEALLGQTREPAKSAQDRTMKKRAVTVALQAIDPDIAAVSEGFGPRSACTQELNKLKSKIAASGAQEAVAAGKEKIQELRKTGAFKGGEKLGRAKTLEEKQAGVSRFFKERGGGSPLSPPSPPGRGIKGEGIAPKVGFGAALGGGMADKAAGAAQSRYGAAREGTMKKLLAANAPDVKLFAPRLKADELRKRGYSDENLRDLERGLLNASNGVQLLHQKHPSAVADAYGSGTMTNIEDSLKWALSGGGYALNRGCRSHQSAVLERMPKDSSMEYKPVMIGKVMEHHAVVAFPKPPDSVRGDPEQYKKWWTEKCVVLDGWKNQTSDPDKMTFGSMDEWRNAFLAFRFMEPRLEEP